MAMDRSGGQRDESMSAPPDGGDPAEIRNRRIDIGAGFVYTVKGSKAFVIACRSHHAERQHEKPPQNNDYRRTLWHLQ